ncbi:MAG: hypothetical protein H6727_10850 [Myxococcales bacterium]|nr:hypothetical protein [Myxococcales bacterium]
MRWLITFFLVWLTHTTAHASVSEHQDRRETTNIYTSFYKVREFPSSKSAQSRTTTAPSTAPAPEKFEEAPYKGIMSVRLMAEYPLLLGSGGTTTFRYFYPLHLELGMNVFESSPGVFSFSGILRMGYALQMDARNILGRGVTFDVPLTLGYRLSKLKAFFSEEMIYVHMPEAKADFVLTYWFLRRLGVQFSLGLAAEWMLPANVVIPQFSFSTGIVF